MFISQSNRRLALTQHCPSKYQSEGIELVVVGCEASQVFNTKFS